MQQQYFEDKVFDKADFTKDVLVAGDYESCIFNSCNFSAADLSGYHFIDCTFVGCNLSLIKLADTVFRDVQFRDCKMIGLLFFDCNSFLFSAEFENCILNNTSFYKMKLKKSQFINCVMQEVDFTETNLTAAILNHSDLLNAKFENSVLEKADLRGAFNYSIDPENNKIKKAKFSLPAAVGLLDKYEVEIE